MKNLKTTIMFIVLCGLTAVLSSCSKDEGGKIGKKSYLVGTWEVVHSKGYEKSGDDINEWDESYEDAFFILYDDGTADVDGERQWIFSGKELIFIYEDKDGMQKDIYKVLELNAHLMVLEYKEKDGDYESYVRFTCKKVKDSKTRARMGDTAGTLPGRRGLMRGR